MKVAGSQDYFLFLSDLERNALDLQVKNKVVWVWNAFRDVVCCIPQIIKGIQGMVKLHNRSWGAPAYILLNEEKLENFRSFPKEMPDRYRKSLVENLQAVQEICQQQNIQEKVYYCTTHRTDSTAAAEAEATGEIIIYDEICTSLPKAAQGTILHEWTHIQHKDGYLCWSLKIAAAAARIFTLYISPWSILLISPLLTYGTLKYSQYCEYRADRIAAEILEDPSDFIQEKYGIAEQIALETIEFIEKSHPNSHCNLSNYKKLSEQERSWIVFKVSDLGIRSISNPVFTHPSYVERYKYLRDLCSK